jgi:hypothetical protein
MNTVENTYEIHHLQGGSWYAIYRGRRRFTDGKEERNRDRGREGALACHRADAEREMGVRLKRVSPWCAGASTTRILASSYEIGKWARLAARGEAKRPMDVAGRTGE